MSATAKVRRNFSRGAATYDANSRFQDKAAARLASMVSGSCAAMSAKKLKILELGCGTGMLSRRLLESFPNASLLATDISPEMLSKCQANCAKLFSGETPRLELRLHDFNVAEPSFSTRFDIVVSALAFQWGANLLSSLRHAKACLAPGGLFFLSIPLSSSLEGLSSVFASAGVPFPGLKLPAPDALSLALKSLFLEEACVEMAAFHEPPCQLSEMLKRLRLSGAVNSGAPLPVGQLRRILRLSGDSNVQACYHVAFCRCK